jgi:hypothetical protein
MRRPTIRTFITALALGLAATLTACDSAEKTDDATTQPAMGAINDTCPVMGEAVDPSASTVDWNGHTIGFCCDGCVKKWNAMTAADKNAFVAKQVNP